MLSPGGVFHIKDLGTFQYYSHNKVSSSIIHDPDRLWHKQIQAFLLKLQPKIIFNHKLNKKSALSQYFLSSACELQPSPQLFSFWPLWWLQHIHREMVFLTRTVGVGCSIGTTGRPMWPPMVYTQLAEMVPVTLHSTLWMPQLLVETLCQCCWYLYGISAHSQQQPILGLMLPTVFYPYLPNRPANPASRTGTGHTIRLYFF